MNDALLDDFYGLKEVNAPAARAQLLPLLEQGEEVPWLSQPKQGLLRAEVSLFWTLFYLLISFFMLWLFLLIFFNCMQHRYFDMASVVLLLVCAFVTYISFKTGLGRAIYNWWFRSRSYFGLTDKALLIRRPQLKERFPLSSIREVQCINKGNNQGHIQFKMPLHKVPNSRQLFAKVITLEWVPNAERVVELILQKQNNLPH